jgi:ATP-dependent exoDNAse (exonuclease V) beta subunit
VDRIKQAVKDGRAALSNLRMEEDLREAFALLEAFEERAVSAKRSRGALTYRDVMELALRILREQEDIRRYYADRFRFIMIDEFQDNNAYQKELLYLLCGSDGREPQSEKLFFVGDDKQSIYRFRGADVSVFKQLAGELERRAGQHIRLPHNYRSSPALTRVFDYLFSRIMAGAQREYEAEYVPIESGEGSATPAAVDGAPVQVAVKPQRDGEQAGGAGAGDTEAGETEELLSNDEAEAFSIAQRIRAMIDAGEPAVEREDGSATPLRYGDIALLMRSTGNQIIFERMFRLFDIPYTTQSVRSLFLEAPAYDIYHVLQLAIYPDDRAAYAGLLRSPLVNVSDEALVRILRSGAAPFAPLPSAELEGLGKEDAERYAAGRELFEDVSARVDQEPLGDVIMHIWYRYGYRYYLLRRPANHPYLEYADYFFELAQTTRYRSVAEFLDFLRANLGTYQRMPELEIVREERGGVQIMTIHKAKGLEFPVVFLANAGNTGRNEGTGTRPYFLSDAHGLTLNMPTADGSARVNHLYEAGKAEEEAKSVAELRRLLYVALTRAESRLIISGAIKRGTSATSSHLGMVLEALGLDPSGEELRFAAPQALSGLLTVEEIPDVGREQALRRTRHPRARDPEEAVQAYAKRLPVEWEPERREFAVTELNAVYARDEIAPPEERPLPAIEEDEALSQAGVEDVFGSVAHWLVREILSGRRAESWRPGPADLPAQYASSLTDERLAAELVAGADRLVTRLFESELGRRLLAARRGDTEATLYSELPFLLYRWVEDGAVWIRGQLDVALVEGSRVFVYDFKTDHLRREGEYDMQLRLYGEAARELFGGPVTTRAIYMRRPDAPYGAPETDVDQALLARCVKRARSPGVPERAEQLLALEEK